MRARVPILLSTALAAGCSSAPVPNLYGHYWWGSGVEAFRPCQSTASFRVVGDGAVLDPLRNRALELASVAGRPYQPIYLEAVGEQEGPGAGAAPGAFAGTFRIDEVIAAGGPAPATCKMY